MEKLLKIVLTLILSVSLVGCGDSSETDSGTSDETIEAIADETIEATTGLEVSDYWYRYDATTVNYYVVVKNSNKNQSFLYPGILVTSYDANNNELETFTKPIGEGIASGDTIYFSSTFNYSQDFDSLVFEIVEDFETASDFGAASGYSDEAYPLSTDFDIVSTVEDNSITGSITNNGEYEVDTYGVVAIFKRDGHVIKASSDFSLGSQFEINTYDVLDYDSYEVYCYAYSLMED